MEAMDSQQLAFCAIAQGQHRPTAQLSWLVTLDVNLLHFLLTSHCFSSILEDKDNHTAFFSASLQSLLRVSDSCRWGPLQCERLQQLFFVLQMLWCELLQVVHLLLGTLGSFNIRIRINK